jgi:hypothetical protein
LPRAFSFWPGGGGKQMGQKGRKRSPASHRQETLPFQESNPQQPSATSPEGQHTVDSRILPPRRPKRSRDAASSPPFDRGPEDRNSTAEPGSVDQHAAHSPKLTLGAWQELLPLLREIQHAAAVDGHGTPPSAPPLARDDRDRSADTGRPT